MWFLQQNNYFAVSSMEIPLLHTWTLGIEEQYYIFCPLILFFITKLCKNIKNIICINYIIFLILFIFSLIFAIFCAKNNSTFLNSFGYYSIFSRAYELMIGSILVISISKNNNINYITHKIKYYYRNKAIIANLCSIMGLVFIILAATCFNESKIKFPSYYTLLPCLGAMLYIYGIGLY